MYTLYSERDLQHKEGEVHTLCRVDNDRHPCTPVAIRGEGIQEAGNNSIRYYPQLVNVIETEEYTVRHPTPASEHTFHPGQEHSPKEELLGQDLGGHGEYHEPGEEPPGALQCLEDILESEYHVEAVALRLSLRLTVAQRRSPSSRRTMIMDRTNNQIKPSVISASLMANAPR